MSGSSGTIVVGIDDHSARQALLWATEQARAERRPLTLVHALGTPAALWTEGAMADPQSVLGPLRTAGQELLEEARTLVAHRAPEVEVHQVLELQDVRDLLRRQARGAALLVLGSRGRGPLRSMLLGSVGASLVHRAPCPMVIHRPFNPGTVRQGVLVACDATADSLAVLEHAYHQAELRRLPLTVLHCYHDVQSYVTGEFPRGHTTIDLEERALDLAEAMAGLGEKYPDVHVSTTLVHGMPELRVVAAAETSDLVVVGAHQGSRVGRIMYGSVSTAVVEHAQCPVMVVPIGTPPAA